MFEVLILGCNRPDNVRKLIEQAISVNAKKIYVHVDYPSYTKDVNEIFSEFIEMSGDYAKFGYIEFWIEKTNLGAAKSITESITKAFDQTESLLILEDDLNVSNAFFSVGWDILEKFKHDNNYCGFSGFNPFIESTNTTELFLSNISQTWGWGTWKTNWEDFIAFRETWLSSEDLAKLLEENTGLTKRQLKFWKRRQSDIEQLPNHVWDYQWLIFNLIFNKVSLYPPMSLVANFGFDNKSTIKSRFRNVYSPKLYDGIVDTPDHYFFHPKLIDDVILKKYYRFNLLWPLNEHIRQFIKRVYLSIHS